MVGTGDANGVKPRPGSEVPKGKGVTVAPPPPTGANVAGAASVAVGRVVFVGKGVGELCNAT